MQRNVIETVLGAVVLCIAGMFLFFAYNSADVSTPNGYEIKAEFQRITGLTAGSDVRISGVKVGTVTGTALDAETYKAIVTLSLNSAIQLPEDTFASIVSESLLGGKFIELEPGIEEDMLAAGDLILNTQSSLDLKSLLGQAIFGMQDGESE